MLLQRVAMMLVGWGLFFEELVDAELRRWEWQNPLICCMIAGFVIVNWTRAGEGFHAVSYTHLTLPTKMQTVRVVKSSAHAGTLRASTPRSMQTPV